MTDVSHQAENHNLSEQNPFYDYLKSLELTPEDIKLFISGVDNADDLPDMVLKQTSKKAISERITKVFNEFPRSKDDFYKLKSILRGGQ